MIELRHLTEQISSGLEVYLTGRSGSSLKTAFVLCDDYTELTTKMYLVHKVTGWSDLRDPNKPGSFKSYKTFMSDLRAELASGDPATATSVAVLHGRMEARRQRRNDFFHSTTLLDLSVTKRDTLDAIVDVLDYGESLFGAEWAAAMASTPNMEMLDALVRADRAAVTDARVSTQMNALLQGMPRNQSARASKGVHLAVFPDDLHFLLAARWGTTKLRRDLLALVP